MCGYALLPLAGTACKHFGRKLLLCVKFSWDPEPESAKGRGGGGWRWERGRRGGGGGGGEEGAEVRRRVCIDGLYYHLVIPKPAGVIWKGPRLGSIHKGVIFVFSPSNKPARGEETKGRRKEMKGRAALNCWHHAGSARHRQATYPPAADGGLGR